MGSKQPFARRIVIAFTLMTLVVSGVFSLSIVGIVHFIEGHLVTEEMDRELNEVLQQDIGQGRAPRLDSSTRLFDSGGDEHAIPPLFAQAPAGFSEVVDGADAYYVYRRDAGERRYLLVQEQHEFEAREQALFNVVLASFVLSVTAAMALGWLVARKVMAPITRLASQVGHRDQLLPLAPPLVNDYADDEIGHLAAAFDRTLGQLRQSLERERLFTSDVSHELRTPLMVIQSSCELLAEARLNAREREQLARIARAAEEMGDLVQTFLILARSPEDHGTVSGGMTLGVAADEQARRWGPAIREKGVQFELIGRNDSGRQYNRTFLRTVLSNLLRNTLHYTEQGSIRLVLEDDGFRIEDTGIGIPASQQERIFQPFVRGTHARGEGLGLGLSLVKRICAHQGWSVGVEPLSPRGSCFRVRFEQAV